MFRESGIFYINFNKNFYFKWRLVFKNIDVFIYEFVLVWKRDELLVIVDYYRDIIVFILLFELIGC